MLHDPVIKKLMRLGWGGALALHGALNLVIPRMRNEICVFYGGARPGDVGGPLVKVKRLRGLFAEAFWGFNLVYTLSNTPYLPDIALKVLAWRSVPLVHNQNGVFYSGWYAGDWQGQNQRMARTYHQADYVFYQSEFCKRSADKFLGEREGPGEILYNAVDTTFYCPAEKTSPSTDHAVRFLLTGKIDDHMYYRVESSIKGLAAAKDVDAELLVAGWVAPEALKQAQNLADELEVAERVRFLGRYTQEEAPGIYQAADAYIMTKHNDPCPNTVLEALASGLPVLYSDTGGVGELVGEAGIGLACEQGWDAPKVPTDEAMAQGMKDIVADLPTFAASARQRAEQRFDIRHWERRHREIFTQLLERT
ncbi:glycosyltransferase family 4 protein [Magnetovibrio sp. PR-2]|uniref:glycosyltransferase family 4 protein n=1 Tax=Magnetovibrio sp. PR-2 TaxID=3120356 RepID=UPI002FCE41B8